jgi:hypothetical protein
MSPAHSPRRWPHVLPPHVSDPCSAACRVGWRWSAERRSRKTPAWCSRACTRSCSQVRNMKMFIPGPGNTHPCTLGTHKRHEKILGLEGCAHLYPIFPVTSLTETRNPDCYTSLCALGGLSPGAAARVLGRAHRYGLPYHISN